MILDDSPVIAAVRDEIDLGHALDADIKIIFLLNASILTIADVVKRCHERAKSAFVHIDLADGIGKDSAGVAYLASVGVDGIISTRSGMIRIAAEHGLMTVQRFFIVDSHSVSTSFEAIENTHPTMIEVMPGIVTKTIEHFVRLSEVPIIAGGMIETKKEIMAALAAGAAAVSTAKYDLWNI